MEIYRFVSPYDENRAVVFYVNNEKNRAVLFSYTLHPRYDPFFNQVRFEGLEPNKNYKIEEKNIFPGEKGSFEQSGSSYTGDFLMSVGLKVSSSKAETYVVLEITEI